MTIPATAGLAYGLMYLMAATDWAKQLNSPHLPTADLAWKDMANLRVGPRCLLPEGTARRPCAGDRAVLSPNRVTQLAARRTFSLRGVAESGHRKAFLREHRMQCGSPKAFSLRRTTGSVHRRPFGRQRGTGSPALIGFVHSLDNPRRVEFYFETHGPEGNGPFRPGPSRFSTKSVPRCFRE